MNRPAAAKDLNAETLRGLDAELEGYAWLPRMLDKARATLAGTAGDYPFGCPIDHTCMARLGITPERVLDLAARHTDDHAVLDALRAHGIPPAAEAWFDGQAVENELQDTGNYLRVRARDALPEAEGGRVFAGAEHGALVSIVLIDAAPGEEQAPHVHPVEEVTAVLEGAATFFLGAQQARDRPSRPGRPCPRRRPTPLGRHRRQPAARGRRARRRRDRHLPGLSGRCPPRRVPLPETEGHGRFPREHECERPGPGPSRVLRTSHESSAKLDGAAGSRRESRNSSALPPLVRRTTTLIVCVGPRSRFVAGARIPAPSASALLSADRATQPSPAARSTP